MDDLPAHKAKKFGKLLNQWELELSFCLLPDFNSIENYWSKLKEVLRIQESRTHEELDQAISKVINLVTSEDIIGALLNREMNV